MINCHIVKTEEELTACRQLLQQVYRNENYLADELTTNKTNSDTTTTFIANEEDRICGTIALIEDSIAGLPMDSIFKTELDTLRLPDVTLAEVGSFAVLDHKHSTSIQQNLIISFSLLAEVISFVLENKNLTHICIAINPKHKQFYESLGFISIGLEKSYPQINHAPALAYYLNTERLTNNPSPALKKLINYK